MFSLRRENWYLLSVDDWVFVKISPRGTSSLDAYHRLSPTNLNHSNKEKKSWREMRHSGFLTFSACALIVFFLPSPCSSSVSEKLARAVESGSGDESIVLRDLHDVSKTKSTDRYKEGYKEQQIVSLDQRVSELLKNSIKNKLKNFISLEEERIENIERLVDDCLSLFYLFFNFCS